MHVTVGRVLIAAACLIWLAGCETTSNGENPFSKLTSVFQAKAPDSDTTGSIHPPPGSPPGSEPMTPELLGADPHDDLSVAKNYFRQGAYGSAERHFRKAVELHPRDAESWIGLAASYDRLRRFDLADRAYAQAIRIVGPIPEVLNNQGFSYMLRGDYRRARATLLAAAGKDPGNPYIQNNLRLLEESARKAKAVN
jgi:tetratricopeptide (TPR) repeat protein